MAYIGLYCMRKKNPYIVQHPFLLATIILNSVVMYATPLNRHILVQWRPKGQSFDLCGLN